MVQLADTVAVTLRLLVAVLANNGAVVKSTTAIASRKHLSCFTELFSLFFNLVLPFAGVGSFLGTAGAISVTSAKSS
jgi:hypothetical protein